MYIIKVLFFSGAQVSSPPVKNSACTKCVLCPKKNCSRKTKSLGLSLVSNVRNKESFAISWRKKFQIRTFGRTELSKRKKRYQVVAFRNVACLLHFVICIYLIISYTDVIQVPVWLRHMMDPKRPKGSPHAPEFILASMQAMGRGVMSSRVNDIAKIFWQSTNIVIPEGNFPDETTLRRWRYGMHYICMVQVGEVLTRAVRNGDTKMTITSDGTPVSLL